MGQEAKATCENRTITVDFHDETTYFGLLHDTRSRTRTLRRMFRDFSQAVCVA